MPLPSEDTTPPVTKIRGVMGVNRVKAAFYRLGAKIANAPAQPAFR